MKIKAVKVRYVQSGVTLEREYLQPGVTLFKDDLDPDRMQTVLFAVNTSDTATLCNNNSFMVDIGRKNRHKGLSRYFLHRKTPVVPLLECGYATANKLIAGARAYLKNAQETGVCNLVAISAEPAIFTKLWRMAGREQVFEPTDSRPVDDILQPNSYLLQRLKEHVVEPPTLRNKYLGNAESVQLIRKQIVVAANSTIPVLILGDTGTGKEIVAREIHNLSERRNQPFKAINCGAISKELLEVELFGCEKDVVGAGYPDRKGLWEAAGKGTLFLDEIGDLSLDHQVKILRTLQENMVRKVGGVNDIPVYARILAASNKSLFNLASSGRFRFDLFYRLNGIPIKTPRLRDHSEDVAILARAMWRKIVQEPDAQLDQESIEFLKSYKWPGNVRELKMVLSGLFALYHNPDPTLRDMQDAFLLQGLCIHAPPVPDSGGDNIHDHRVKCLQHLKKAHEIFHGLINELSSSPPREVNTISTTDKERDSNSLMSLVNELDMLCGKDSYYFLKQSIADDSKKILNDLMFLIDSGQQAVSPGNLISRLDSLVARLVEAIESVINRAE